MTFSNKSAALQIEQVGESSFETKQGSLDQTWYFGDNLLFGTPDEGKDPFAYNVSDYFFAIKKAEPNDVVEDYDVDIESFTIDGIRYLAASVAYQGKPHASSLAIYGGSVEKSSFLPRVEYALLHGEGLTAEDALYEIRVDGATRYVVGTKKEGGVEARAFVSSPYGDFDCAGETLYLNGIDSASFRGKAYALAYEEGRAVLTEGKEKIVFSLDLEARQATIVEESVVEGASFLGKKYQGTFYSPWDECDASVYLEFDAEKAVLKSAIASNANASTSTGILYMNGLASAYGRGETPYVYDEATFTLVASIVDVQNKNGKEARFVYDPIADAWTMQTSWSNVYPTSGVRLSLLS